MDSPDAFENMRASLPNMPPRSSSFQTPPVANNDDEVERLQAQLASVTKELAEMKAKARLGDYAGGLFNFLKQNAPEDSHLKGHATTVDDNLKV
ncbi:hypothetical protein RBB50_004580 [Rhinocladiella similis]